VYDDVFRTCASQTITETTIRTGHAAGFRGAGYFVFLWSDLININAIRAVSHGLRFRGFV